MKSVTCLYLMLAFTLHTFAQKIKDKQLFISNGLLDVQSGVSIPVADYGLQKLTLPAGYAQSGYNIKLGIITILCPFGG